MEKENKKKKLKLRNKDLTQIYHPYAVSFKEILVDEGKCDFSVNFRFRGKIEMMVGNAKIETKGLIRILEADDSHDGECYKDLSLTLEKKYSISSEEKAVFHNLYELILDAYLSGKSKK